MSKAVAIPGCDKDLGGIREEISTLSPTEKKDGPVGLFSRLLRFDSLSKKSSASGSPTSGEPLQTYYGVYIPCEIKKGPDEEALHVYKNKSEALELVKRYKLARFKAFQNRQEAISFTLRGADIENHEGNDNSLMGEKPYPFKAPSPQDMVALRKTIEAGLAATVRDRVWDNPRYLVSSGNTPAIMQEGSRYNALHVAAKAMNAELCNLILNTVGNPEFVQKLYGGDADDECCKEFAQILVDRYLNTPDKAMNETPLHFAAKFGAEEAVDVLTSFPQCDKMAINKYGETPRDVICKRSEQGTPHTVRRIAALLDERFYVPVLHSEDDSSLPAIGKPFTPAVPPELNQDPLSPRYEIRAFAGPMQARDAESFRRRWKTPPRSAVRPPAFRLNDLAKGLENVGRNLAEEMKVGWKEYWPFLDTFTDLRTPEGLALLENFLKAKYENACSFAYSDSCADLQPPEDLSLSRISLNLSQQSPPKDSTMSPMSELCNAMKTCTISSERPPHWRKTDPIRQRMCRQPSKLASLTNGEASSTTNHTVSQLLCIERTCQVFAKRIADALIFSLTAEPEVAGESLKAEAKHLQHTIYTYMDDERFQSINFALIHSRLAQLVVFKLKQQTKDLDDINHLIEFLMKLRCPNDDIFSSDDERKPMFRGPVRVKITHVIDCHVRCLSSFISEELIENDVTKGPSISESECTEIWDKAAKCRCEWKIECFERNSKKNASFRKNRSILSTSPKSESFIKRLTFDYEIGDGKSQNNECEKPMSVNSPGGDSAPPALYTVDVDKCRVVEAEISEDDSVGSAHSDGDEYHTASENEASTTDATAVASVKEEDDGGGMQDASDRALAEPFIYGEEPSKMDRLVYDAIAECGITASDYPNVYRWRHTVALYSPSDRLKWPQAIPSSDSAAASPITYTLSLGQSPVGCGSRVRGRRSLRDARQSPAADRCSTPKKGDTSFLNDSTGRSLPLQVSNWLRVTGPNSPRSSPATKSLGHNVSFGF